MSSKAPAAAPVQVPAKPPPPAITVSVPVPEDGWSLLGALSLAVAAFGLNELYYWWAKPGTPYKKDYKNDIVYVYQFRRTPVIPSLSPYCLALETFLRFAKIQYENVICNPWLRSKENKLPFIEVNGCQYSTTNDCILRLTEDRQIFDVEASVDSELTKNTELNIENLMWCYFYFRYIKNQKELFSPKIIGKVSPKEPIMPWCSPAFARMRLTGDRCYQQGEVGHLASAVANYVTQQLAEHGIKRLIESEISEKGYNHLKYLSEVLGSKQFLLGNQTSSTDCILFGVTAQIFYVPYKSPLKGFMEKEFKNLIEHCKRMKISYWPDWEKILKTLKLNTYSGDDGDD